MLWPNVQQRIPRGPHPPQGPWPLGAKMDQRLRRERRMHH